MRSLRAAAAPSANTKTLAERVGSPRRFQLTAERAIRVRRQRAIRARWDALQVFLIMSMEPDSQP